MNNFINSRKYLVQAFKASDYFYFQVKSSNNKVVVKSRNYTSKENCLKVATMFANDLKCQVEFKDINEDYEY